MASDVAFRFADPHVLDGWRRAGATLLYDSDHELEERETRVKASAFLDAQNRDLNKTLSELGLVK